jgi:hypothetical protein
MEAIMRKVPWNKGRLTGQKRPLKPKDVWAIRVRLQLEHKARDLALFNLAIDSKLRLDRETDDHRRDRHRRAGENEAVRELGRAEAPGIRGGVPSSGVRSVRS